VLPGPGLVVAEYGRRAVAEPRVPPSALVVEIIPTVEDLAVAVAEDGAVRAELVEPRPEGARALARDEVRVLVLQVVEGDLPEPRDSRVDGLDDLGGGVLDPHQELHRVHALARGEGGVLVGPSMGGLEGDGVVLLAPCGEPPVDHDLRSQHALHPALHRGLGVPAEGGRDPGVGASADPAEEVEDVGDGLVVECGSVVVAALEGVHLRPAPVRELRVEHVGEPSEEGPPVVGVAVGFVGLREEPHLLGGRVIVERADVAPAPLRVVVLAWPAGAAAEVDVLGPPTGGGLVGEEDVGDPPGLRAREPCSVHPVPEERGPARGGGGPGAPAEGLQLSLHRGAVSLGAGAGASQVAVPGGALLRGE
jgi:hypothetical protein